MGVYIFNARFLYEVLGRDAVVPHHAPHQRAGLDAHVAEDLLDPLRPALDPATAVELQRALDHLADPVGETQGASRVQVVGAHRVGHQLEIADQCGERSVDRVRHASRQGRRRWPVRRPVGLALVRYLVLPCKNRGHCCNPASGWTQSTRGRHV